MEIEHNYRDGNRRIIQEFSHRHKSFHNDLRAI